MLIKADLHVHTTHSKDSLITPKDLIFYTKKNGLNAVAVTDHNYLEGAWEIAKGTDFLVIPGMEISSADGHIIALNIKERIPKGLPAIKTVEEIHKAGGVAIACHPYVLFKGCLRENVCNEFDAIETINARAFPFKRSVKKATEAAEKFDLSQVGGTDAHYGPQIGSGYTAIEASEPTVDAVAEAIIKGNCEACGHPVPVIVNARQQFLRLKRMMLKLR